jgi:hypothetical protein
MDKHQRQEQLERMLEDCIHKRSKAETEHQKGFYGGKIHILQQIYFDVTGYYYRRGQLHEHEMRQGRLFK